MWEWIVIAIVLLFGLVVFRGAPYVPSQKRYVRQALTELYPLGKKDVLVDVGSGDGVVLRIASQLGARAVGYELNPALVVISRLLSLRDKKVSVRLVDFWLTPLPDDTTVVYGFMVTRDMKKMTKKMQREADRLNRPLAFLTYGNEIIGRSVDKMHGPYRWYTFHPLQSDKA